MVNIGQVAVNYLRARSAERFGQYFCNTQLAENETWPELFYEEDNFKAIQLILERYFPQEKE